MEHLTIAYILKKEQVLPIILHEDTMLRQKDASHFLLIYSITSMFTKITLYPVKYLPITKYFLHGSNIQQGIIDQMLTILNSVSPTIIHTSGITFKEKQYCYELYFSGVSDEDLFRFKNEILNLEAVEALEDSIVPFYNI